MCSPAVCIRAAFFQHSPARADYGGDEEVEVEVLRITSCMQPLPCMPVEGVEIALAINGRAIVAYGGEV